MIFGVIIVLKRAESGISPHDPFNCAVNYKMGIYDRHLIALDQMKVQEGAQAIPPCHHQKVGV